MSLQGPLGESLRLQVKPPCLSVSPPQLPAFDFDADPDAAFYYVADPDQASQNDSIHMRIRISNTIVNPIFFLKQGSYVFFLKILAGKVRRCDQQEGSTTQLEVPVSLQFRTIENKTHICFGFLRTDSDHQCNHHPPQQTKHYRLFYSLCFFSLSISSFCMADKPQRCMQHKNCKNQHINKNRM